MKYIFMMLTICLSTALHGQHYSKILNQKFTLEDLNYMPITEMRLLKNELIATNGSDIIRSRDTSAQAPVESPSPFLDEISEANLLLLSTLENNLSQSDDLCTNEELYERFLDLIEQEQNIPFYLQKRFLGNCQNATANIYLIPISKNFYTLGISEQPEIGPISHVLITLNQEGQRIDYKSMLGKAKFENGQIIHESFNSLIEYTYSIDEDGNFDQQTPTKQG